MNDKIKYYEKMGNWDFSDINSIEENEKCWNMYEELKKHADEKSLILDLGTGGGENILSETPDEIGMIIGTDLSPKMIETANKNLKKFPNKRAKFVVMDNLKLQFPNNLFDVILARHTVINAKEIYRCLKKDGVLILRGVDKYDCWNLKKLFGRGQAFHDEKAISEIDYKDITNAGFTDVSLIKLKYKEIFNTKEDLLKLLLKTPILDDFSETEECKNTHIDRIEKDLFEEYVKNNNTERGIVLQREYYGIVAKK